MKTDVTIISTSLNKNLLDKYFDYKVIDSTFTKEDLLKYKKVVFFNILNNVSEKEIKEIFDLLNTNNISFINITNNVELVLLTSYLIVYDKNDIIIEGKTLEVLKYEKLLKRVGLSLPFMVELSLFLQDYGLIDTIYLDKESLVDELWK